VYMPIIHFSLLTYSKPVTEHIQEQGFDLFAKNDFQFMKAVFELLVNLTLTLRKMFLNSNLKSPSTSFSKAGYQKRKLFSLWKLSIVLSKDTNL